MHRFLVVVERAGRGYSAYSPDLPGCVSTGRTHDDVTRHMFEAIQMHLKGIREDNVPVPKGRSPVEYVADAHGAQSIRSDDYEFHNRFREWLHSTDQSIQGTGRDSR